MALAVYTTMVPAAQDPLQELLVKAGYWAQSVAEAAGGPFTSGMYPNMTPFAQDPLQVLAAKLAYWLQQVSIGGGGGGGSTNPVYVGAAPPAAPAFPIQGAFFVPDNSALPLQTWDVNLAAWRTV